MAKHQLEVRIYLGKGVIGTRTHYLITEVILPQDFEVLPQIEQLKIIAKEKQYIFKTILTQSSHEAAIRDTLDLLKRDPSLVKFEIYHLRRLPAFEHLNSDELDPMALDQIKWKYEDLSKNHGRARG